MKTLKKLFLFSLMVMTNYVSGQDYPSPNAQTEFFKSDSRIVIEKKSTKGFSQDYMLFIPKGTLFLKKTFLIVEPNNTGKVSDSIEVFRKYAVDLASVSSVKNNIPTELRIPLLVSVFPSPEAQS